MQDDDSINRLAVHPSVKYETEQPTIWRRMAGLSYALLIVGAAFLDMAYVLVPGRLIVKPLAGVEAYKNFYDWAERHYFAMVSGMIETWFGMQLVITTDSDELGADTFADTDQILLLANHRSEVDWIFIWNLAMRFDRHDELRLMLKAAIRHVPGAGWATMMLDFLYVDRDWSSDEARLRKQLRSFKQTKKGTWVGMFPEGTALYDRTLTKSEEFAKKNGEASYSYVLHPRVKGFQLCVQEQDPDYILDMTVGYPELSEGVRPSPIRFLKGLVPKEVHIHLSKYHRCEFPSEIEEAGEWMKRKWAEKEKLLHRFYQTNSFKDQRPVCQDVTIAHKVRMGIFVHIVELVLAAGLTYYFPWAATAWWSFCTIFAVHLTRTFGQVPTSVST